MAHEFIEALRKDHNEQRELSKKFSKARKPAEWKPLFKEIHEELKPHVEGEEASFFGRLKQSDDDDTRFDALEKLQEHHVADLLLEEALKMDQESEEFWAKIKVLMEVNEDHIDEEEEETFSTLQKQFSDKELDQFFQQYKEKKEAVKKEM